MCHISLSLAGNQSTPESVAESQQLPNDSTTALPSSLTHLVGARTNIAPNIAPAISLSSLSAGPLTSLQDSHTVNYSGVNVYTPNSTTASSIQPSIPISTVPGSPINALSGQKTVDNLNAGINSKEGHNPMRTASSVVNMGLEPNMPTCAETLIDQLCSDKQQTQTSHVTGSD